MLFVLLILLLVVGGAVTAGGVMYLNEKRRRGLPSGDNKLLPAGDGSLIERTVRDPRVGDVLTMDGKDFLVEGVVSYDEDGHRWKAARLVDASDVLWMVVGLERAGTSPVRLLRADDETEIAGYPPEALLIGTIRYALDKRGTATCKLAGDVGQLAGGKGTRPDNAVERCRWWLYNAAGDDTLVLEQWGSDFRLLRGHKISPDTIDLIAGS